MSDVALARAELRQLDARLTGEVPGGQRALLQFNPESLKVSFANQLQTPTGTGDRSGTPARQFVGAGTTKLSLTVVFDVTQPLAEGEAAVDDVRRLTQKVAFFITPQEVPAQGQQAPQHLPPGVRFLWGSFQFDGLMDSLEESLDFFSAEGKPLRATLTLALSQQRITRFAFAAPNAAPRPAGAGGAGAAPGVQPLTAAPAGATVQGLAAAAGRADDRQAIARANAIENPRRLAPGQLLDLDVSA